VKNKFIEEIEKVIGPKKNEKNGDKNEKENKIEEVKVGDSDGFEIV